MPHIAKILCLAVAVLLPQSSGAPVQAQGISAPESGTESHHLSFAVTQDIIANASPRRLLDIFQEPKLWSPNMIAHEHIGGPPKGVGSEYSVSTKVDGEIMTRRELTIVADDRRIVTRILSDPPFKAVTFAEFAVAPQGAATRITFNIYLDAETATAVAPSMIPAMIQRNEAILAGHLQRIKALAEHAAAGEKRP